MEFKLLSIAQYLAKLYAAASNRCSTILASVKRYRYRKILQKLRFMQARRKYKQQVIRSCQIYRIDKANSTIQQKNF